VDRAAAEDWIRARVEVTGELELASDRPWATTFRVPTPDGIVWFKACAPVQAYEPQLTASLFERWPDRVVEVLAHDVDRAWLLLADGGTPVGAFGDTPGAFEAALPLYAELQRGEVAHVDEHLAARVPDLRVEALPSEYAALVESDAPFRPDERERARRFAPRFADLCGGLADWPATVQHDDLHDGNVYARDGRLLILDWGDTSISHPLFSLVVLFRSLERFGHLDSRSPWFVRLRDAFLEAWDTDVATAALAVRVGTIARVFAWLRIRSTMPPDFLVQFDGEWFPAILGRALAQMDE
jgi:phosphotransferase family enzyme